MPNSMVRRVFMAAVVGMGFATIAAAPPAIAAEAPVVIPATAAEIWKAIDMHIKELHADIDKGALNKTHEHAFAIRDLVRALLTHSPGLSADALAKVSAGVKFVDTLAERLDQTGDANDKPGTVANTDKLEKQLASIRANYPAN